MRAALRISTIFIVASSLVTPSGVSQKKKSAAAPAPVAAPAAKTPRSLLSYDEYEHLLNLIFPVDHALPMGMEYSIVLRFESLTNHPESQVVIRRWHDGRVEATLYRVEKGNAWQAAYGHNPDGKNFDFPAIVKDISIKQNRVLVSTQMVDHWHSELFPVIEHQFAHVRSNDKRISRTGTAGISQSGTRYELWFLQPDDEVHVASWDVETEVLPTGTYPLTKWMNLIRFHAEGHMLGAVPKAVVDAPKTPAP